MITNFEQLDGALLAARYAFMPNKLRYCGGDSNSELFEYAAHQASDDGLKAMLKEFETMFPYLRLIAEANKIADPFNYKVVEAYWLGNELLEKVSMNNFYRYLVDEQKLKKKLKPALLEKVFGKIPAGAKPHHSFHVLSIPKRTGNYPVEHTLCTMDECRIALGKVKSQKAKGKTECQNSKVDFTRSIHVEYQPLIALGNNIALGELKEREVWAEMDKKVFANDLKAGDWVAVHWGWVCDRLTDLQASNLQKWTKYNLSLANLH
jgi:hydrogenase maturation factor